MTTPPARSAADVPADMVTVVTGGGSGIGHATVEQLLVLGTTVHVLDLDVSHLDELSEKFADQLHVHELDARNEETVIGVMDLVGEAHGRIDALVNAIGVEHVSTIDETTRADWNRVLDVNLTTYFLTARAAVPHLRRAGGSIVNVASQLALVGTGRFSAYTASKAGIVGFSRSLALELAEQGIRVNVVCPGAVDTPLLRRQFANGPGPQGSLEDLVGMHAMKRLGRPEEIAAPIVFLCGPGSAFMTGSVVVADGGYTSW
ncbi:SDR family NAD(P)-dependent oxidoreductase [Streptomyces tendae]|uniref:SDR family NAD(P)-dependent oxidoreductase n=1 Tax=Streptomyces tendae TaxID=1932 RepID=UPI0036D1C25A